MSLGRNTVRGAAWTITASIGSRAVGLVGTLVLARFIAPAAYGEVMIASVLVMSAQQISTLGVGQYVIAKREAGPTAAFHATVIHLTLGALAFLALLALDAPLSRWLDTPGAQAFVPGLLIGGVFDRVAFMPERILARDMRFRVISVARAVGEVCYAAVAVSFAVFGWGAMAIVFGYVARSALRGAVMSLAVERARWLKAHPLSTEEGRQILGFGLPISVGALAAFASRRWDNLLIAGFFGPGAAGMYNLAYNLADVPAIQVGEQVGDVLLPSFAQMSPERRGEALLQALGLLGLIVFPLAVGLGAIAPTLVDVLFDPRWQPVGPMLLILSVLSVTRPVAWTIAAFLQAQSRPRWVMGLEGFKLVALLIALATVGRASPIWACVSVGVGFALHTAASLWAIQRIFTTPTLREFFARLAGPIVACVPLGLGVLAARWAYRSAGGQNMLASLILEILAGALAYILAAFAFAPTTSRELMFRVRDALPRNA